MDNTLVSEQSSGVSPVVGVVFFGLLLEEDEATLLLGFFVAVFIMVRMNECYSIVLCMIFFRCEIDVGAIKERPVGLMSD